MNDLSGANGLSRPQARHDLYRAVHRGIRHAHGRMMTKLAATDPADEAAVGAAIARLKDHLLMCLSHLSHEDAVIHTAVEARVPGGAHAADEGHEEHEAAFAEIEDLIAAVEAAGAETRSARLDALYRRFARFVGDDLLHMEVEEGVLMPLMQQHFTDAELIDIETRIVSGIAPEKMALFLRAMLGAMCRAERAGMLVGMQSGMPPEAFDGLMRGVVGASWRMGDWAALDAALD